MPRPAPPATILDLGGRRYDIAHRALVMGILNRTPDSFFDKGATWDWDAFWARADQIVADGADILDVGAVKAGPGPEVTEGEEMDRLLPAVVGLVERFDLPVSVDTWRASVAEESYRAGAVLGNDISGFADPEYLRVAAAHGASVVATHIRLAPRVPDPEPVYADLVGEVSAFLLERAQRAEAAGIPPGRVLVDAGLDLGKTAAQSLELLRRSTALAGLGYPLLLSASNKTFLGVILDLEITERREATAAAHALGISLGCRVVRAHDVRGTCRVRDMLAAILEARSEGGRSEGGRSEGGRSEGPLPDGDQAGGGTVSGAAVGAASDGSAWLITGDNPSLVAEAVSNLVSELVEGVDRSLVLEDYGGEELDLGVVVDACATPPFLADRRVVVLRDAGNHTADQLQPLAAYLEDPLPTTRLVVAGGGGNLPAKFVNAFKKAPGTTVVNTDVSNREAHLWFSQRLARAPVKLGPAAAALVEEHLGEDLDRLTALLATLEAAYGHGVRIDEEHLRPYLGEPGSVPPWDLTEAIDNGETETALKVLHRLLAAGDRHPLVVLAILHRHFGNVLRLQSPAITSEAEAAQALGVPKGRSTFPARKALDAARRLGPSGSGDAILALADAELALKGKVDLPPGLVLEVLVARLCRLSRARASRGGAPAVGGSHRRR